MSTKLKVYIFPQKDEPTQKGDEYLSLNAQRSVVWTPLPNYPMPVLEHEVGYIRRELKQVSQTALIEELEDHNCATGVRKDNPCGSSFHIRQKEFLSEENTDLENSIIVARARQLVEQREEVLSAFIAKYGFEPERFMQVQDEKGRWCVTRMTDEQLENLKKLTVTPA